MTVERLTMVNAHYISQYRLLFSLSETKLVSPFQYEERNLLVIFQKMPNTKWFL